MNTILFIILYFFIGVGVYYVDTQLVKHITKKSGKGMVIGRGVVAKIVTAFCTMVMITYLWTRFGGTTHGESELLNYLLAVASIVVGLYLGNRTLKWLPGSVKRSIEYANRVEKGEANPLQDLSKKMKPEVNIHFGEETKVESPKVELPKEVKPKEEEKVVVPLVKEEEKSFDEELKDIFKKG